MNVEGFVAELTSWFRTHAHPDKAVAMSAYMKNRYAFLGIQTPERNALLKTFLQAHGRPENEQQLEQIVKLLWAQPEREFQNVAMTLLDARGKRTEESRIKLLESLIIDKSWWDTVDFLAGNLSGSYLTHYPEQIEGYPDRWIRSDNLWLRRSAILFQLHYKDRTDKERLFQYIRICSHEKEFFIAKAIGWALRQYAKVNPDDVLAFAANEFLQPLSRREALKLLTART
ncbi:DNA alkylation repair protein [Paenibacillus lactis]|uniref:DNA alkylation repair enzyme n=1 Tax=Paenibacillus lactis 154 TaxID=743719 RepID=G4HL65_9BACL|nr:DNA alkylation repair protein [Paenibacillus lactis]EHB57519.1 DNA alkylation repair enzyme [Paenibacillus lactis 154]